MTRFFDSHVLCMCNRLKITIELIKECLHFGDATKHKGAVFFHTKKTRKTSLSFFSVFLRFPFHLKQKFPEAEKTLRKCVEHKST